MLEGIDLSGADLDVYRYIARYSRCTVADIADGLGEPYDTVRANCRRLADHGLLVSENSSAVRVTPGGPDTVFEVLQAQIEREYAIRHRAAVDLRHDLTQMLGEGLLADSPGGGVPVEELPSAKATQVRLLELAGHARKEVLRMWTQVPETASPAVAAEQMVINRAIRRGLGVRIIYPTAFAGREVAQRLAAVNGAAVRTVSDPPVELYMFDRRVAVMAPSSRTAVSLAVRGQPLAHVLHSFFETWWVHGREPSRTDDSTPGLTDEDLALLQLLAEGAKDENIARQLGLSVRTVRRKVSRLLDALDATSRFQAGVRAARRGWV